MSLGWLELVSLLGLPLFLGAALLELAGVRRGHDRLAWPAWCAAAGALGTAAVLFLWLSAGGPIEARWIAPALGLAALAAHGLARARRAGPRVELREALPRCWSDAPGVERVLFGAVLGLLVALAIARILEASLHPVVEGDEAHLWALKAKTLFESGGLGDRFGAALGTPGLMSHVDYPLLNPLLQVWAFAHEGAILHVENRFPIQVASVALVPMLGAALRRVARPGFAALILWLVVARGMAAIEAGTAQSEGLVALGLLIALDGALRWREGRETWQLALVGIGLALATWAKNEGILWCIAAAGAAAAARLLPGGGSRSLRAARGNESMAPRAARGAGWLLLPLAPIALTAVFNWRYGLENDLVTGDYRGEGMFTLFFHQLDERWSTVAEWIAREILLAPADNHWILLSALLLAALFPIACLGGALRVPTLAFAIAGVGVLAVYVGTPHDLLWHLATSAPRVASQLVPAAALWLGLAAGELLPGFGASRVGRAPDGAPGRTSRAGPDQDSRADPAGRAGAARSGGALRLAPAVLAGLALALGAVEIGLRAAPPAAVRLAAVDVDEGVASLLHPRRGLFALDEELGFLPVLGGSEYDARGCLRNDYAPAKSPGVERVLFLGDSVTKRARIVKALRALHGEASCEYWNAGVESYNTAQELAYFRRYCGDLGADQVVLTFHLNDFETTPMLFLDRLGRLQRIQPGVPNRELVPWLMRHSYLYRLWVGLRSGAGSPTDAEVLRQDLAELARLCAERGARLSVIVLPLLWEDDRWPVLAEQRRAAILRILAELGIRHFDLRDPYREALAAGLPVQAQPGDPMHPGPEVAELFARDLEVRGLLAR